MSGRCGFCRGHSDGWLFAHDNILEISMLIVIDLDRVLEIRQI